MAWTYSGDPGSSEKDAVRFEIPDTSENEQLFSDEEIEYALEQQGTVFGAAAECCEIVARQMSAEADTQTGSLKEEFSKAAKGYAERARELRVRAQALAIPFGGGVERRQKEANANNGRLVKPLFRIRQFEIRGRRGGF